MTTKLRFGILGTGNIAQQVTAGITTSHRCVAQAVGSRTAQSAQQFAKSNKLPSHHGSYEALIADPNVDAVYISLPNHLHHQWTLAALRAGKHVLCEKPLAMNAAEAVEMFDAAQAAGRVLMEAFMYRCHPQTQAVVNAVRSGAIGDLRLIRTSFCYRTRRIDGNVRFVREIGGGSLMDVGCYCINFARLFAGAEPEKIHGTATFHETGVDDLVAGEMQFPKGIVSTFVAGMSTQADNSAHLCGTDGYIEVPFPWKPPPRQSRFIITKGIPPRQDKGPAASGPPPRDVHFVDAGQDLYAIEADDFAAAVLDDKPPRIPKEDSLGNMRVLDTLRAQIGLTF